MVAREAAEPIVLDTDHVAGSFGNFGIFIWRFRTLTEAVKAGAEMMRELQNRYPQGVGLVQVVEPTGTAPDAECRKALAELLERGRNAIRCSSVIYEITGFKGAAMRSVVSTLSLIARTDFPHRVFASTTEALQWQVPLVPAVAGLPWNVAEIEDAIGRLRERLHSYDAR
jgi:hypothetical protein